MYSNSGLVSAKLLGRTFGVPGDSMSLWEGHLMYLGNLRALCLFKGCRDCGPFLFFLSLSLAFHNHGQDESIELIPMVYSIKKKKSITHKGYAIS